MLMFDGIGFYDPFNNLGHIRTIISSPALLLSYVNQEYRFAKTFPVLILNAMFKTSVIHPELILFPLAIG